MQKLSDLDLNDDQSLSAEETRVLEQYFEKKKDVVMKACNDSKFRQAIYFTIIFILLNNPLADTLFEIVASPNLRYVAKLVVFFILSYVVLLVGK